MAVLFAILVGLSLLLSLSLVIAGVFGLARGQTYALDFAENTARKVEGPEARRASVLYLAAGLIWLGYVIYRLLAGL